MTQYIKLQFQTPMKSDFKIINSNKVLCTTVSISFNRKSSNQQVMVKKAYNKQLGTYHISKINIIYLAYKYI